MAYADDLTAIINRTAGWEAAWAAGWPAYSEDQQKISMAMVMKSGVDTQNVAPTVYTGDAAIGLTVGKAVLTKGSAAAMTLAAPTAAQDGLTIVITSGSSYAHVITGTNLFWSGQTGGPYNKITLAAFIGASATVMAYNALWHVVSHSVGAATVGD